MRRARRKVGIFFLIISALVSGFFSHASYCAEMYISNVLMMIILISNKVLSMKKKIAS